MTTVPAIRRLADAPQSLPGIVALIRHTWPEWYCGEDGASAEEDVGSRCARTGIPLGLVALDAADEVLGTVALGLTGHGAAPEEGPWVNGLCVAPQARGAGIGGALVAAAEAEIRRQGYSRAFATAGDARRLFERRGWRPLRELDDGWTVFCRDFEPGVASPLPS